MQIAAHIVGDLQPIVHHVIHTQLGRNRPARLGEGLAGAWLVPLHDDKVLLPGTRDEGTARRSGSPVDHEQDGVEAILAADGDPLVHSAHSDEPRFVDPVGGRDGRDDGGLVLAPGAISQGGADRHDDEQYKCEQTLENDVSHGRSPNFQITYQQYVPKV